MDNIIEPTMDYDFSKLYLGPPSTLTGGAYFTKLMHNNKPIYIQTPKSLTKQGFIKSGKKTYTDLMFDNNDTVFIQWMENLESKCQELIFSKGQTWFETKLEKEDLESAFTSPFKIFKSGKFYLLRVNVKQNIKIYDETDQIINCEDVNAEKNIISILEIQGIKFTSRNFQIEFEMKQAMIVSPDPFLDECFIKKPVKKQTNNLVEQELEQEKLVVEQELEQELEQEKLVVEPNNDHLEVIELDLDQFINGAAQSLSENSINDKGVEETIVKPMDLNVSFENEDSDKSSLSQSNSLAEYDTIDDNIVLDVEELEPEPEIIEDINALTEVDLTSTLKNNLETITLKKPNQVYYEIYQKAREKAKEAKKNALLAYLEVKNIKKTYMLDDMDDSDSEFDDLSSKENDSDAESLEDTF